MNWVTALSFLHAFAAFNGLIVALILMTSGKSESRRSRLTLGGFLFVGSGLLALFVLLDQGVLAYGRPLGIVMEILSAAMPVLFLDYVLTTIGRPNGRNWLYAIIPVFALTALFIGDFLGAMTNFGGAIALQMAATVIGAVMWQRVLRAPQTSPKRRKAMRLLSYLFGLMAVLHVVQIARFLMPGETILFDLVPTIGTLGLTAFVVATLLGSRTLSDMVKTPEERQKDPALEQALKDNILTTGAFLDQGVTLDQITILIPTEPQILSDYLNSAHGQTFREWLTGHRIAHAKSLLVDSEEERTSIEAIGLMSGFKSRSAFYEAFKAVTGQSPHQFRERASDK